MHFIVSYHLFKNSLIQYFQKSGQKNIQLAYKWSWQSYYFEIANLL